MIRLFRRFRRDLRRIQQMIEKVETEGVGFDPQFLQLVLVLEDKRFMNHIGVDMLAAMRAAGNLLAGRARGGASTIDMQLARTITGYRARTVARKLYESALAITVRRRAKPEGILNTYLTLAHFGTGIIGADAAANGLFDRPISRLSNEEFAEIAAMLVYPMPRELRSDWRRRLRQRAVYGLRRRERLKKRLSMPSHGEYRPRTG